MADYDWIQKNPAHQPGHSYADPRLVYDSARDRIILVGESTAGTGADLAIWDGADWTDVTPLTAPPKRFGFGVAYDAARDQIVMFGGIIDSTGLQTDETWLYDCATADWSLAAPATSPPVRDSPGMAYAPFGPYVLLFGGSGAIGAIGDTWTWDGTDWTDQAPGAAPSARVGPGLVYDADFDLVYLHGGFPGGYSAQTWSWDGGWTNEVPANDPGQTYYWQLAYNAAIVRVLAVPQGTTNTWTWDGVDWTQIFPATSPPSAGVLAHHTASGETILYKNAALLANRETWAYRPGPGPGVYLPPTIIG